MLPERWRKKPPSLRMGAWFLKVNEALFDVGENAAFNVGKREPEENIGLSSTVAWIANEGEGKGQSFTLFLHSNRICFEWIVLLLALLKKNYEKVHCGYNTPLEMKWQTSQRWKLKTNVSVLSTRNLWQPGPKFWMRIQDIITVPPRYYLTPALEIGKQILALDRVCGMKV